MLQLFALAAPACRSVLNPVLHSALVLLERISVNDDRVAETRIRAEIIYSFSEYTRVKTKQAYVGIYGYISVRKTVSRML